MIFKISACIMRILRESCYAFAIMCRFKELHFELFHGIFLLFHIQMELFSVISMRHFIYLALPCPLILIWLRNTYMVPATKPLPPISTVFTVTLYKSFSSSFLRSSYLLVLYSWLWSIRLSYGIDSYTTIIFKVRPWQNNNIWSQTFARYCFYVFVLPSG